ncbi:uncharacterized protein [Prorops nasuta]|uniref:uncharacterized protein n=1 Tax=Prorops nasuta TaxID=863751 RepID=UPI0034CFAA2F
MNDPTSRVMRWRERLKEFDFKIVYKSGKNNTNADALSRNPIETAEVYWNSSKKTSGQSTSRQLTSSSTRTSTGTTRRVPAQGVAPLPRPDQPKEGTSATLKMQSGTSSTSAPKTGTVSKKKVVLNVPPRKPAAKTDTTKPKSILKSAKPSVNKDPDYKASSYSQQQILRGKSDANSSEPRDWSRYQLRERNKIPKTLKGLESESYQNKTIDSELETTIEPSSERSIAQDSDSTGETRPNTTSNSQLNNSEITMDRDTISRNDLIDPKQPQKSSESPIINTRNEAGLPSSTPLRRITKSNELIRPNETTIAPSTNALFTPGTENDTDNFADSSTETIKETITHKEDDYSLHIQNYIILGLIHLHISKTLLATSTKSQLTRHRSLAVLRITRRMTQEKN